MSTHIDHGTEIPHAGDEDQNPPVDPNVTSEQDHGHNSHVGRVVVFGVTSALVAGGVGGGIAWANRDHSDAAPVTEPDAQSTSQPLDGSQSSTPAEQSPSTDPSTDPTNPANVLVPGLPNDKAEEIAQENAATAEDNALSDQAYIESFQVHGKDIASAYDLIEHSRDNAERLYNTGGILRKAEAIKLFDETTQGQNDYDTIAQNFAKKIVDIYSRIPGQYVTPQTSIDGYVSRLHSMALAHAYAILSDHDNTDPTVIGLDNVDNVVIDKNTVTAEPLSDNVPLTDVKDGDTVTVSYKTTAKGESTSYTDENDPTKDVVIDAGTIVNETWRYDEAADQWMIINIDNTPAN